MAWTILRHGVSYTRHGKHWDIVSHTPDMENIETPMSSLNSLDLGKFLSINNIKQTRDILLLINLIQYMRLVQKRVTINSKTPINQSTILFHPYVTSYALDILFLPCLSVKRVKNIFSSNFEKFKKNKFTCWVKNSYQSWIKKKRCANTDCSES